ncbi:MAG TPA: hypothetical protein ENO29_07600 [Candidatus Aminicenantes bacterium]|nr:MAG: hypothetical protein C0168_11020 [Candidatus Aminicenantes bacterium]HEK86198.1 hypothetical protein [Candidatus Aminicenantes bacterium]
MKKLLMIIVVIAILYGGNKILGGNIQIEKYYTLCKGSDAVCQLPGSAGTPCGSEMGCYCKYFFLVGTYCVREVQAD